MPSYILWVCRCGTRYLYLLTHTHTPPTCNICNSAVQATNQRVLRSVPVRLPHEILGELCSSSPHVVDATQQDPDDISVQVFRRHPLVERYGVGRCTSLGLYSDATPVYKVEMGIAPDRHTAKCKHYNIAKQMQVFLGSINVAILYLFCIAAYWSVLVWGSPIIIIRAIQWLLAT